MSALPWLVSLITLLAGAGGVWYYRRMWSTAKLALDTIEGVQVAWAAQATAQANRMAKVLAQLEDRQNKEAVHDSAIARGASRDPAIASDLLNGLHPGGQDFGSGVRPVVSPESTSGVPDTGNSTLR